MNKLRLKDIAKNLNLSISTISKSLSDSYEISEETKKLVKAYVEKHHYSPNRLAKNLKTGKTNTIGVIVSDITNAFTAQVLDGVQRSSYSANYDVVIMQSGNDGEQEKQAIDFLATRGIDGLLISPVSHDSNFDDLQDLQSKGIPVVLFDRIDHRLKTHRVGIDNQRSAYQATQHLVDTGRRRILHVTAKGIGVAADRLSGYKKCLCDFGIPLDSYLYLECDGNGHQEVEWAVEKKIRELCDMGRMPDAIFGATDNVTIMSLSVLAAMQIPVPEEVAVVGFSNIAFPWSLNPALSTIVQPAAEIGKMALKTLIRFMQVDKLAEGFTTVTLDAELIPRLSSLPRTHAVIPSMCT